jgi:hypothetical protein
MLPVGPSAQRRFIGPPEKYAPVVSPVERLRAAVAEIPAIDHHAHLLARDPHLRLAEVLTEARDPAQIEAGREHPAYLRAWPELAEVLGPDVSEERLAEMRADDLAGHAARLLGACRLEAMFVDDGFRPQGAVSLDEHAALVGCPVRRIIRVEAEVEAAAAGAGWPPLAELRDRLGRAVTDALAAGAAGLKTIAAYRCGLELPTPSVEAASRAYDGWRRSGTPRLEDVELVALFLTDALEAAGRDVPLQVHTGLGDADQALAGADPARLQPQVDHGFLAGVPVVLLHCYPYVRHAGYLAAIYADVHVDLSLAIMLVPQRGPELVAQALELAPVTKLMFASDASRLPEVYLLATVRGRESLARALGGLVADGFLDEHRALAWAELVLAGNARRVYGPTQASSPTSSDSSR